MKKYLYLLVVLMLAIGLSACAGDSASGSDGEPESKTQDSQDESENVAKKEEPKKEDENIQESEVGKMTIAYKNKELNENAESGPISLNINAIQVADLEVADDYKEMFDNKDKVTVITLQMNVENNSDETIGIYPDQATITTDTGDQSNAETFLSDEVGGDFIGKVKKEGNVIFVVNTPASEIGQVNFIVDGAHNEDYDEVGEQIKLSFTTK